MCTLRCVTIAGGVSRAVGVNFSWLRFLYVSLAARLYSVGGVKSRGGGQRPGPLNRKMIVPLGFWYHFGPAGISLYFLGGRTLWRGGGKPRGGSDLAQGEVKICRDGGVYCHTS